jgi:hypothetical protein
LKERDFGRVVDIDPQTPSFVRYSRRHPQITHIRIIKLAALRLFVSLPLLSVRLAQGLAGAPLCSSTTLEKAGNG